ncbi:MAG: hypothetical protein ACRDIX_06240 [Actinomycetota bacterium]
MARAGVHVGRHLGLPLRRDVPADALPEGDALVPGRVRAPIRPQDQSVALEQVDADPVEAVPPGESLDDLLDDLGLHDRAV